MIKNEADRVLMELIREGDRSAFRELLERYRSPLIKYASGIVAGHDEAQDVIQDVFIRVWRHRSRWAATGSVSAYLYRITRNLALNRRRDRQVQDSWREGAEFELRIPSQPATPDEKLEERKLRQEVDAAIEALPERRQEVFVLSRFHGLSYREIGETMDISPQTVANQMSAALSQLRDALSHRLDDS